MLLWNNETKIKWGKIQIPNYYHLISERCTELREVNAIN